MNTAIQVREISVKRKFNLGNYETMDIEMIATIGENQSAELIIAAVDREIIRIGNERRK